MGVINNEVAALKRKAAADGRFDGSDRRGNQSTRREFYRWPGAEASILMASLVAPVKS